MKLHINVRGSIKDNEWEVEAVPNVGDFLAIEGKFYRVSYLVHGRDGNGKIITEAHCGFPHAILPSSGE